MAPNFLFLLLATFIIPSCANPTPKSQDEYCMNRCILYETRYTKSHPDVVQNLCDTKTERCVPDNLDTCLLGCDYPLGWCMPLADAKNTAKPSCSKCEAKTTLRECLSSRCIVYRTPFTKANPAAVQNLCSATERCVPDDLNCVIDVNIEGNPPECKGKCKCEQPLGWCEPLSDLTKPFF